MNFDREEKIQIAAFESVPIAGQGVAAGKRLRYNDRSTRERQASRGHRGEGDMH